MLRDDSILSYTRSDSDSYQCRSWSNTRHHNSKVVNRIMPKIVDIDISSAGVLSISHPEGRTEQFDITRLFGLAIRDGRQELISSSKTIDLVVSIDVDQHVVLRDIDLHAAHDIITAWIGVRVR